MTLVEVLHKLQSAGKERTKKSYVSRGVHEPLFGVAVKELNPIAKEIGKDQQLATQLYQTGNYDAMYLAAMVADPAGMTPSDFDAWMDKAYCPLLGNYTMAILLADAPFATTLAQEWIGNANPLFASAGWYTYTWLFGVKKDAYFNRLEVQQLLKTAQENFAQAPQEVQDAMEEFVAAVGVSYIPLHNEAVEIAKKWSEQGSAFAANTIESATQKGKLGFKRRALRC